MTAAVRRSHLVNVIQFKVLQKQQQDGRDGFNDDFFVPVDVDAEFHALQNRRPAEGERRGQGSLDKNLTNLLKHVMHSFYTVRFVQKLKSSHCGSELDNMTATGKLKSETYCRISLLKHIFI